MKQVIKTKFLCKRGSQISPNGRLGIAKSQIVWKDRFIEGKWYDGEYETWSFERGYEMNDGWRKYWVVNEMGKKEEVSRANFKVPDAVLDSTRTSLAFQSLPLLSMSLDLKDHPTEKGDHV